jgi:hypothetical protein
MISWILHCRQWQRRKKQRHRHEIGNLKKKLKKSEDMKKYYTGFGERLKTKNVQQGTQFQNQELIY